MSFLLLSEPTLTIANLTTALEEVEMRHLCRILNVPESRQRGAKKAIIEEFIQNHPAPSWRLIADRLNTFYDSVHDEYGVYHTALQNVKRKYLKGEDVILCTCELDFVVVNVLAKVISLNWNRYPQQLKL